MIQRFEDIHKECKKAYNGLVIRKDVNYKFTGQKLTLNEILVCHPDIDETFNLENMQWLKQYRNQSFIDQFITGVLHMGMQQGYDMAMKKIEDENKVKHYENISLRELARSIRDEK